VKGIVADPVYKAENTAVGTRCALWAYTQNFGILKQLILIVTTRR
jgi:hypothetical protein